MERPRICVRTVSCGAQFHRKGFISLSYALFVSSRAQPHREGAVKLSDFGLAAELAPGLTRLVGTPEYLAPELVRALRDRQRQQSQNDTSAPLQTYDERVDNWALGHFPPLPMHTPLKNPSLPPPTFTTPRGVSKVGSGGRGGR